MSEHSVERSLPPMTDTEQGSLLESSDGTVVIIDPITDPVDAKDSPWNQKEGWKHRMRRWITKPWVWVLLILVAVTIAFFTPAYSSGFYPNDSVKNYGAKHKRGGVEMYGSVFSFDWLNPGMLSVMWTVIGHGNYSYYGNLNGTSPNMTVDIYLNNLSSPVFSYEPASLPISQYGGKLVVGNIVSFTMEHYIDDGYQYLAPGDEYDFSAFVFAIERNTNTPVPIRAFEVYDYGSGDFTTTSSSEPGNITFTYNAGGEPITLEVESQVLFASIVRSVSARVLTYSMFAINWMLAFCSAAITIAAFSRRSKKSDVGITFLPVTVVLAIPAIRNLFVGSPPLGIFLDVLGFFPQMLIVASCTVLILVAYLLKFIQDKDVGVEEKAGV